MMKIEKLLNETLFLNFIFDLHQHERICNGTLPKYYKFELKREVTPSKRLAYLSIEGN